ncbi:low specificity L-threonine aldolase, partial [Corallococcus praedator]
MKPIDFRSDTVTKPTPAMRRLIADAEVGDDVYGEDPTVRRLEERVAERLGLEAAVFVPSGTQANQIAIGAHCRTGDEVLTEEGSHILHYEGGAVPALWGVQPAALPGERGLLTPRTVTAAVREDNIHNPRTRLLSLENTHNRGGGTVWPLERSGQVHREP